MPIKRLSVFYVLLALVFGTSGAVAAEGGLRVGAARVDVTGKLGPSQTGKYDHEKVYVRAIVLDNGTMRAALVSAEKDGGNFDDTLQAIQTELNCPAENVIISMTHTHSASVESAPWAPGKPRQVPSGPSEAILQAVRQAGAALQPAIMGFDTGNSYLNVNRDGIDPETRKWAQYSNLNAPSDRTVAVLTFKKPSGEPIAVYVNYAMHGINGYVSGIVSGDFSGAMSRYVEKAFGDNIVVAFTQGASGDQNPLYLRPSNNVMASRAGNPITGFEINRETSEQPLRNHSMGLLGSDAPPPPEADPRVLDHLLRFIESEGQILGEEVIRVMTWTRQWTGDVRIEGLQREVSCPGRKRTNGDLKSREPMQGTYEDAPPRLYKIGVLGIGTTAVAWVSAEIYTLIGMAAKDAAPMKNTMVVTIANGGRSGYTPDDASYGHQTFQVLGSGVKQGCAETAIVDTIAELETRYMNRR